MKDVISIPMGMGPSEPMNGTKSTVSEQLHFMLFVRIYCHRCMRNLCSERD